MKRFTTALLSMIIVLGMVGMVRADLLYEASLKDGDYGSGEQIDTMDPNQGGSPHVLGIVDEPDGVTFTSTETDGRSNALINWVTADNRITFKLHGTISFWFKADRDTHVGGEIFAENYGYDKYHHGQGSFSAAAIRIANNEGIEDDQVQLTWKSWHNNVWYNNINPAPSLEYDRWYNIGFAWGGPDNDYEIWVDGELVSAANLPDGVSFPWGQESISCPSGTNLGLGSNHERGYADYGSVAGATFADISIWDEYVSQGDTIKPLALVSPPAGNTPLSAPTFEWVPGQYDLYLFYSVFNLTGLGYHPITFWLGDTSFVLPEVLWSRLAPQYPQFWFVLGFNVTTSDLDFSDPSWFTKAP